MLRRYWILLCVILAGGILVGAPAAGAAGEFLYVLHDTPIGNLIYGFRVDPITGRLTRLRGFPRPTGADGDGEEATDRLAYDAHHQRLFVLNNNAGADTVSVFRVNTTSGALTALPLSPIRLARTGWSCLAIHPSGSPLVVGDANNRRLASFTITATAAVAAAGSPYSTGLAAPFSCAFSRDGRYIYTGGGGGTRLAGLHVNAATGVLSRLPGSPFNVGAGALFPLAYATDTARRLFLAAYDGQVRVYTTTNGVPQSVTGNPFPSGLQSPAHGLLHPAGFYLVADARNTSTPGAVGVYRIRGSGANTRLAAVSGSPFDTGTVGTYVLALNPTGAFLFASNALNLDLTTFAIDVSSGALTSRAHTPVGTPSAMERHRLTGMVYATALPPPAPPTGYLYALRDDPSGNSIYGFAVEATTGALTRLRGFPRRTGGRGDGVGRSAPERLVYDAANRYLYAINSGSNTVSAYAVNRVTGALTPLPYSPIALPTAGTPWNCIVVHPSGSPLIAGSTTLDRLASFAITPTAATPAPGSPYSTRTTGIASCTLSRNGVYLYASSASAATAGFRVAPATGRLTPLSDSPFATGLNDGLVPSAAYVTDRAGRLFTSASDATRTGEVRVFTTSRGVPQAVTGNPFPSGLTFPSHGVLHPAGFYIVVDTLNLARLRSVLGVYRIVENGAGTMVTPGSGSPFVSGGDFTNVLALDQEGDFLFAADTANRNIATFLVQPTGRALRSQHLQPVGTLGGTSGDIAGLAFVAR